MSKYTFTNYFENDVLTKRPYLKKEWCIYVIENPILCEPQEDNRFRFWAQIEEFGDRRYAEGKLPLKILWKPTQI